LRYFQDGWISTNTHSATVLLIGRFQKSVPFFFPDFKPTLIFFLDLDNTEDEETDAGGITEKRVPPPKQLTLETHLNKSLVIGWNPPDNFPIHKIESYRVVVDAGETRATVTGTFFFEGNSVLREKVYNTIHFLTFFYCLHLLSAKILFFYSIYIE